MSHVWTVQALDYAVSSGGKTNVVGTVHWRATKTQGDDIVEVYGTVGLADPGDTFIERAKVTQADAIAWAKAALGRDQVTRLEASLDAQLTEKITPTTGSGQPWAA